MACRLNLLYFPLNCYELLEKLQAAYRPGLPYAIQKVVPPVKELQEPLFPIHSTIAPDYFRSQRQKRAS